MEALNQTFENCKILMEQTQQSQQETLKDLQQQSETLEEIKHKYQEIDNQIKQTETLKREIQLSFFNRQWSNLLILLFKYTEAVKQFISYMFWAENQVNEQEFQWQIYNENMQDIQELVLDEQMTSSNENITVNTQNQQQVIRLHSTDIMIDELIQNAEVLSYLAENIKTKLQQDQTEIKCIDFSYQKYINLRHLH